MSIIGTVQNGVVVLSPGVQLPEGTEVRVEAVELTEQRRLGEATNDLAKTVHSLPDDLAVNHDYYLHGHQRKQQPRQNRWIAAEAAAPKLTAAEAAEEANQLASMAAETSGLPADLSTNHDHYLHGWQEN